MSHDRTDPTATPGFARGGMALIGLLLIGSNLRAAITSVGPVLGTIQQDQNLSAVAASVLISVPLAAFAIVSPIAPAIAAKLGLETSLAAALAALAVGIVLRSTPPQPLLWLGTLLLGVGIALLNVLLPALVKRDFPLAIGQVTGMYSAVQSACAALAAGLAVPVAGEAPQGWRLALGIWAGLALIGLAVLLPRLRRQHRLPAGGESIHPPAAEVPASGRRLWRSALAWQVTAYMGLQSLAFYVLIAWLSSIEQSAGISAATAGFHLLLFNLLALLGNIACSTLIPRMPDQRFIALGTGALLALASAGLLVAPRAALLWAGIAGFGGGASLVLALSLFGLRTSDATMAAKLSGMAQSIGYAAAALGPIVIGALFDLTGSWTSSLLLLIGAAVLQAIAGVLASRPRTV